MFQGFSIVFVAIPFLKVISQVLIADGEVDRLQFLEEYEQIGYILFGKVFNKPITYRKLQIAFQSEVIGDEAFGRNCQV